MGAYRSVFFLAVLAVGCGGRTSGTVGNGSSAGMTSAGPVLPIPAPRASAGVATSGSSGFAGEGSAGTAIGGAGVSSGEGSGTQAATGFSGGQPTGCEGCVAIADAS